MELLEVRAELVAIATATATLPCTCRPGRGDCLACRASSAVDDLASRGLRMHRWRNTSPAPRAVVHVAGDVVDERRPRPGMPRFIVDRWQCCTVCGHELVHGRWALFYAPDALVAVRASRSGTGRASLVFPASGSVREEPCWAPPADVHPDVSVTVSAVQPRNSANRARVALMRIVIYTRVSTDQQADEGLGLQVQEDQCRAWAKANRHKVAAVCSDAGRSGKDGLVDRPGLAEALAMVRLGKAAGVVVQRLDRLARDVVVQETFLAELARYGAALHSTSATEDVHLEDDPDDPTRALVRRILGSIAMYEREMIRLRLAAGMKAKASVGGYIGGRPSYGWLATGRELQKDPAEQLVIRKMLSAHRRGVSLHAIAAQMNESGLMARNGGPWYPMTVSRIIERNKPKEKISA